MQESDKKKTVWEEFKLICSTMVYMASILFIVFMCTFWYAMSTLEPLE